MGKFGMRSSQREVLPMWHQQTWCSTVEVHDECVYNSVYVDCRCCAVSAAHGGRAEQGSELPWLGHPPAQLLVLLWLFCGVLCQAARLRLLLQVTPVPSLLSFPRPHSGEVGQSLTTGPVPCPALPCPALPSPALPCPAMPCHALPCPALPRPAPAFDSQLLDKHSLYCLASQYKTSSALLSTTPAPASPFHILDRRDTASLTMFL